MSPMEHSVGDVVTYTAQSGATITGVIQSFAMVDGQIGAYIVDETGMRFAPTASIQSR